MHWFSRMIDRHRHRAFKLLWGITIAICLYAFLFAPQLVCACNAWKPKVVAMGLVPLGWAVLLVLIYSGRRERVAAHLSFVLAVLVFVSAAMSAGWFVRPFG